MKKNMNKEEKIKELEDKIDTLSEHRSMWFHTGNIGERMAMQANQKIHELMMQKNNLTNTIKKKETQLKILKSK